MIKNNHLLRDYTVCDSSNRGRTAKVFAGLEEICKTFDLSVPLWLDGNISDFRRMSKTRFTEDSFIEEIGFDYLEIRVIEED